MIDAIRQSYVALESKIAEGPVVPQVSAGEIRDYLASRYDFEHSMPLDEVAADVAQMLREWQVQVTHPRYFGLFNPSVTLASVVADTLVAMYNPQLANWRTSPAANEMERHTLAWLARKFGMPANTSATFTTGGSEANLSAVIVALTRAFPTYAEQGLRGLAGQPVFYVTKEAHHCFHKIAHMTGLGRAAVRMIATGADLRLDLRDLERCVAEDRSRGLLPFLVVGTAGTTAAGIIDPLPELGRFCRAEGLWFHVDAAWGGGAVVSPKLARHLAGTELADSITCDAHKWLSVSMSCGMFFCRHPESVAEAFRAQVSYMPGKTADASANGDSTYDPFTQSVQWSRRFIGLKLFMTIAEHGEQGCVEMVEHQARLGEVLRASLASTGWRIVNRSPFPVVCFTRERLDPTSLLAAMRNEQIGWMSEAVLDGVPVMRACITSYKTTESDLRWVVAEMNRICGVDPLGVAYEHALETMEPSPVS